MLDIIEDHITRSVVRVQAAGDSGRGAYFQQVTLDRDASIAVSSTRTKVPVCVTIHEG